MYQKGEMKEVPHWGPTNNRCHNSKFSYHGNLQPGISALLYATTYFCYKLYVNYTNHTGISIRSNYSRSYM